MSNEDRLLNVRDTRIIWDRVLFIFPASRELQFSAAAVLQDFVNGYDAKMRANTPTNMPVTFRLLYDVSISDEDWSFFQDIGLRLNKPRTALDRRPDAIFDLSEARLEPFHFSSKHVAQVMGVFTGVSCLPLPRIRTVKPKMDPPHLWGAYSAIFGGFRETTGQGLFDGFARIKDEELIQIQDNAWSGFMAHRGWHSYLIASMGLPVIELVENLNDRFWLPKWTNRGWRLVDLSAGNIEWQIAQAKRELEEMLRCLAAARDRNSSTIATEVSTSTAFSAESL